MAASVNFNTADRIIRTGLKSAGLLQEGDDPNSEMTAECMNRLNDIVNLWQTRGIKLFLMSMVPLTLVAGTASYTFGPAGTGSKLMQVLEGYYSLNGVDRPLDPLSWNTYNALANKTQQGEVTSFLADYQTLNTVITLWLVPDTSAALGTCKFLVRNQITNLINLTDSMMFPNEWYMALHWALADEMCTGQPDAIVQRCAQKAAMYLEALEAWDVGTDSVSFAPNFNGKASSFR